MNRRQFLVAAAAIPALAKAIVAAPAAELPITGILRSGLQEFEIIYPDGTVWSFAGMITAQSESEVTIKPSGSMTMSYAPVERFALKPDSMMPDEPTASASSYGTVITRAGLPLAEIRDITLPSLTRVDYDESYVGLRRTGEITFCGRFL